MSNMRIPPKVTQGIVMAAGRGRMGALTSYNMRDHEGNMAACCLPVGGRRNVNRVIQQLVDHGATNLSVISHHLAGDVIAGVGHGDIFECPGLNIRHVVIPGDLQHRASIAEAIKVNPFNEQEPFWVLGATTLHPKANLDAMRAAFAQALACNPNLIGCIGVVLRPARTVLGRFGIAVLDEQNYVQKFIEKPASHTEIEAAVNATKNKAVEEASKSVGEALLPVYTSYALLLRDIFEQTEGTGDSLGSEIFAHLPPALIHAYIMPEPVVGTAIRQEWYHLATPRDHWLAEWRFLRAAPHDVRGEFNSSFHSWFGRDVVVRQGAQVINSILGDRVYVGPGVVLDGAIVGTDSVLHACDIKNAILLPHTHLNHTIFTTRVERIANSIVGGRTTGGTLIDGYTMNGLEIISNEAAVPDKGGQIKPSPLGLSQADINEAEMVKKEVF
jgi:NDP-sugar pyrophosphorylase family protein